jgi:hypothetical protein
MAAGSVSGRMKAISLMNLPACTSTPSPLWGEGWGEGQVPIDRL